MDVSIVILNYNTFALTSNAIRSVYNFTTGVEFEVILVDNNSTEYDAALFKNEFPGIVLIKNTENAGFAKGNNFGIKHAKGNSILLMNSDVVLTENSILKCLQKLKSLPEDTAAISCKLTYPDGRIQYQCNRFPGILNPFMELTRIHKLFSKQKRAEIFLSSYFDNLSDIYPDWIWGTFFMFKRELLHLLPGEHLNEDYFMYCEDMKWCYDFKKIHKRVYYFAGTTVLHLSGQSYTDKATKEVTIARNESDFVLKTKGLPYYLVYKIINFLNVFFSS